MEGGYKVKEMARKFYDQSQNLKCPDRQKLVSNLRR